MTAALEAGEWSAARPGRNLPLGKTRYPFYRKAGWAPGPVWTGRRSRPHRNSIPDLPTRSQSLYRLSYPAHRTLCSQTNYNTSDAKDIIYYVFMIKFYKVIQLYRFRYILGIKTPILQSEGYAIHILRSNGFSNEVRIKQ